MGPTSAAHLSMSTPRATTERLQTLLDLAGSLTSTLELEEVLDELVRRVRELSEPTSLAISVYDGERDGVTTLVGMVAGAKEQLNADEELYRLADFPATRRVVKENVPVQVRLSNRKDDARERALLESAGFRSLLMLPLVVRGETVGVLEVFDAKERGFGPEVVEFWQGVCGIVAVALRNASLYADVHRLALEALNAEEHERLRLSEMLHDGALQSLCAARHDVVAARAGDSGSLERVETAVKECVALLRDGIAELHPVVRQQAGLKEALKALARRSGGRGGFDFTVAVASDATGVHDELVLSVARELLTNAAKHARAKRVSISVEREDEDLLLTVADDGVGLPPERQVAAVRDGHIGLASVAVRVQAVGGQLEIKTSAGRGTAVTASIPASGAASLPVPIGSPRLAAASGEAGR